MEPTIFRRDPYLRTSAYHLATWSLVAFVLELRRSVTPAAMDTLSQVLVLVLLVAGAVMTSLTHERRVGKMAGPAGEAVFDGAGRMWTGLIAVLVATGALALVSSRPQLLFDVWVVGVGSGLAIWGSQASFAWYVGLGAAMVATGLLDATLASAGESVFALRCAVLAAALPAAALVTNHRFLWFHPPA